MTTPIKAELPDQQTQQMNPRLRAEIIKNLQKQNIELPENLSDKQLALIWVTAF